MKQGYTHIAVVIDRSGSMLPLRNEVISGFNEFIIEQQKLPGEATFSMYQFSDGVDKMIDFFKLSDVPRLNERTYVCNGWTALYDAMGQAIEETGQRLAAMNEEDRPDKVLVLTITDGHNNSSHRFSSERIKEMVRIQEDVYKWKFAYQGANQDAVLVGESLGIDRGATMSFAADSQGLTSAIRSSSMALCSYRSGGDYAYADADRALQDRTSVPVGSSVGDVPANPIATVAMSAPLGATPSADLVPPSVTGSLPVDPPPRPNLDHPRRRGDRRGSRS